jgi:hypothetical protein
VRVVTAGARGADTLEEGGFREAELVRTRGLVCLVGGVALGLVAAWCAWLGLVGFMGYPTLVAAYGFGGLAPWAVVPSGSATELLAVLDWTTVSENVTDPAAYVPIITLAICVGVAYYGVRSLRAAAD